jgi:hypothetical protein
MEVPSHYVTITIISPNDGAPVKVPAEALPSSPLWCC